MNKQILNKATESTDTPTPGYIYVEISKNVNSSKQALDDTITYLTRRLNSKSNHNIKYKCLKVFDMISQNSITRGQFKLSLRQNTEAINAIKNCLNFRGPLDPVRGDGPYSRIRGQAKGTLNTIYSDDKSSSSSSFIAYGYGNQSSSVISNDSLKNFGTILSAERRNNMHGIGNTMCKHSTFKESSEHTLKKMTIKDIAGAAIEGFAGIIRDPLARNSDQVKDFVPRTRRSETEVSEVKCAPSQSTKAWNILPPGQIELSNATNGEWTMASNRGPNAIDFGSDGIGDLPKTHPIVNSGATLPCKPVSVSISPFTVSGEIPSSTNLSPSSCIGSALLDGNYERNLVMDLCPPGGMRAEPPHDKLHSFIQSVSSLDPDLVCPALLDALEDGQPWIIRAKALCVIEVVINVAEKLRQNEDNNAYADFFHACIEEIEPLSRHSRVAVREPCKRVLKALGMNVEEGEISSSLVPGASTNLLQFCELDPSSSNTCPQLSTDNSFVQEDSSLFGGMTIKDKFILPQSTQILAENNSPTTTRTHKHSSPTPYFTDARLSPKFEPSDIVINEMAYNNKNTVDCGIMTSSKKMTSAFSFITNNGRRNNFDPLLEVGTPNDASMTNHNLSPTSGTQANSILQQPNLDISMQTFKKKSMNGSSFPCLLRHGQNCLDELSSTDGSANKLMKQTCIMGGSNATGSTTSFTFLDDPVKLRKEASNKKFDFVQDAMKNAK